jgi:hypothetical protein
MKKKLEEKIVIYNMAIQCFMSFSFPHMALEKYWSVQLKNKNVKFGLKFEKTSKALYYLQFRVLHHISNRNKVYFLN